MPPQTPTWRPASGARSHTLARRVARRFRLGQRLAIWSVLAVALGGLLLGALVRQRQAAEALLKQESHLAAQQAHLLASRRTVHVEKRLPAHSTFSEFLEDAGVDGATVRKLVEDARPVYNLARVRAGNRVSLVTSAQGELRALGYQIDADRLLWVTKQADRYHAELRAIPYTVSVTGVAGRLRHSLFEAVAEQGEGDLLTLEIADIFGWDIDFSTDPRPGDTFQVLVEKKTLNGQRWGYGRVLATQYRNAGHLYQAVLFRDPSGRPAYYAPSGKSVAKAFLRSPLKFGAAVTSGFSHRRFHPILRRYRPHLGVDYRAPVGSAVQAVADGRVLSAGWDRGGGKTIRLRHAKGYETYYLHLSRILVRRGRRVQQGQIIGRSGATGMATGPHLDFRVKQGGRFRNFLRLKLPPARSVSHEDWDEFLAVRDEMLARLAELEAAQAGPVQQTAD